MKVFEGLTSLFKETDDDDFLEDGYLEEDFIDPDKVKKEEKPKKSFFSALKRDKSESSAEPETVRAGSRTANPNKVVPIHTTSKNMEVVVIHPENMDDANEITDTLLSGRAVVLNLEGIHLEVAQRIIDYSAGSCYAMRGNLQKITNYIFLVTPSNVEISGDFQEMLNTGIDLGAYKSNYQY